MRRRVTLRAHDSDPFKTTFTPRLLRTHARVCACVHSHARVSAHPCVSQVSALPFSLRLQKRPDIFVIGNCPHDWLFPRVAACVHHGGAGTVAASLRAGKPTLVRAWLLVTRWSWSEESPLVWMEADRRGFNRRVMIQVFHTGTTSINACDGACTSLAGDPILRRPAHVGCDGQPLWCGPTGDSHRRRQLARAGRRVPRSPTARNRPRGRIAGQPCSLGARLS